VWQPNHDGWGGVHAFRLDGAVWVLSEDLVRKMMWVKRSQSAERRDGRDLFIC
jgi:hypothetical protein